MHPLILHGFTISGDRLQRFLHRAVIGLGITIWAGLIIQWNGEGLGETVSARAPDPFQLTSICSGDAAPTACINGCWVGVGDELPAHTTAAKVLNIDPDQVHLSHHGERVVLRIHDRDVRWDMIEVTR